MRLRRYASPQTGGLAISHSWHSGDSATRLYFHYQLEGGELQLTVVDVRD